MRTWTRAVGDHADDAGNREPNRRIVWLFTAGGLLVTAAAAVLSAPKVPIVALLVGAVLAAVVPPLISALLQVELERQGNAVLDLQRWTGGAAMEGHRARVIDESYTELRVHHTRLRRLVAPAFTPHAITGYRPRIEKVVGDLLNAVPADGPWDLVASLASPLPIAVITDKYATNGCLCKVPIPPHLPRDGSAVAGTGVGAGFDASRRWSARYTRTVRRMPQVSAVRPDATTR